MATMDSAGISDAGRIRKGNEDAFSLDDDLRLYVVADGMGGHAAGEIASRVVVETVCAFVRRFAADPLGAAKLPQTVPDLSVETNLLVNAVHLANRTVHRKSVEDDAYRGMGSTVSAVRFGENRLSVVNVGDSPVYLVRPGRIEVVSTPHTMADEYRELAPKSAESVGDHLRHVLTRAVGLGPRVEPDAVEARLSGKEIVVICSDGLSDAVSPEEILEVVTYERPGRAGKTLVAMANERGGEDNITVVIAKSETAAVHRKPAPSAKPAAADTEDADRNGVPVRVAVDYDTEDSSHRATVTAVRENGVFLETTEAVTVGEKITLTLASELGAEPVMIEGRVVARKPTGIEIRFDGAAPARRLWLRAVSGR